MSARVSIYLQQRFYSTYFRLSKTVDRSRITQLADVLAYAVLLVATATAVALSEPRTTYRVGSVPDPRWIPFGCVGVLACLWVMRKWDGLQGRNVGWAVLSAAAIPLVSDVAKVPFALAAAAGLVSLCRPDARLGGALAGTSLAMGFAALATEVYGLLDAQYDAATIIAPLMIAATGFRARLLGEGNIAIQLDGVERTVHASQDKLGGIALFALVALFVGVCLVRRTGWRLLAGGCLVALLYAVLLAAFSIARNHGLRTYNWSSEIEFAVRFVPLAALLGALLSQARSKEAAEAPKRLAALALAGAALVSIGWFFYDPGLPKRGVA